MTTQNEQKQYILPLENHLKAMPTLLRADISQLESLTSYNLYRDRFEGNHNLFRGYREAARISKDACQSLLNALKRVPKESQESQMHDFGNSLGRHLGLEYVKMALNNLDQELRDKYTDEIVKGGKEEEVEDRLSKMAFIKVKEILSDEASRMDSEFIRAKRSPILSVKLGKITDKAYDNIVRMINEEYEKLLSGGSQDEHQ